MLVSSWRYCWDWVENTFVSSTIILYVTMKKILDWTPEKRWGAWFKMSFFTKSQSRDAYIWITQAGVDRLSTFAGFCFCLSEVPRRKQTVCHWADRKLMPAIPQERCLPITLKKNKEKRLTCLKRRVLTYFRVNFFQD